LQLGQMEVPLAVRNRCDLRFRLRDLDNFCFGSAITWPPQILSLGLAENQEGGILTPCRGLATGEEGDERMGME
jgi:hypothetical protein